MRTLQNIFLLSLAVFGAAMIVAGVCEAEALKAGVAWFSGSILFSLSAGLLHDINTGHK